MSTFVSETDIVGSNIKADNGYGRNGYLGASSDLRPGKKSTTSGFLPQVHVPQHADWQTRPVSAAMACPAHPGMSAQRAAEKVPSINMRRAAAPRTNKSFQR